MAYAFDEYIRGGLVALAHRNVQDQLGMALDCNERVDVAKVRVIFWPNVDSTFPHYAHALGLHATRACLDRGSLTIKHADVDEAIKRCLLDIDQTIKSVYDRAVFSPQKDTLHAQVLLACALARTGEFGDFPASAIREPLSAITGKAYDIPGFSKHLKDFGDEARGKILRKEGVERKFRFRFRNPLMRPLIIMKGINDHRLSVDILKRFQAWPRRSGGPRHFVIQSQGMQVPLTPVRCLYRAVDFYGKKTGVVSGPCRFTYAQFGERCERLAFGLQTLGVAPGDRVAYLSFNNHQLLEGYYGPPLMRAIVMPLNVRLAPAELTGILNHAEPRVLIYESDFAPLVDHLRQTCPAVRHWVEIGEPYEELLSHGRLDRPDVFSFDENEIAELFYTSGSTGTPKGVMLSHRTLYMHTLYVAGTFYHDDTEVELHTIPLFHANGWGRPQAATMVGLKHVMVRRFEPVQVLRMIEAERATAMSMVPTMAVAMLNCPELGRYDVSSVKNINLGGAASSPELVARLEQAFPGVGVFVGYGLTETSPVATCARDKSTVTYADEQDRLHHRASTGWALPGCEIRVVDPTMKDVPRDRQSIGEIVIRGDLVMDGYYKEPAATAAVMTNGWFHTGDMAVWDEENFLLIMDRKKDIIISGGENISSIEVERAIGAHPAILECAVVSAPDSQWGEVPAAYVVLKSGQELSEEQLCEFLRQRIAKFKMPRRFQFSATALPKTGTGKIIKRELREAFWLGQTKRVQG